MGIDRRGKSWRARVTLPDRSQRSRSFRTKAEAVRWEAEQKTALNRGIRWIPDTTTVAEYAYRWTSMRPHRPSTARNVHSLIKHHIEGTRLGSRRVGAVRPSEVQAWATERSKVMSPIRIRNLVSMLRAIFRDAVLDRLCAENPAARVVIPSFEKPLVVPLTVAEIQALTDAIPERCKAMVIVQAGAGLRISELLALRVQDVDFLRRTIRVECQFAPNSKIRVEPKTPRSKRVIPVPTFVIDAIAEQLRRFPPQTTARSSPTSMAIRGATTAIASESSRRQCGRRGCRMTRRPCVRHFYASVLLAAGESVVTVANRLGHANPTVTLNVYGHLIEGQDLSSDPQRSRSGVVKIIGEGAGHSRSVGHLTSSIGAEVSLTSNTTTWGGMALFSSEPVGRGLHRRRGRGWPAGRTAVRSSAARSGRSTGGLRRLPS